jgi:pimeloyl-ACP methyl ester carboxylesterase
VMSLAGVRKPARLITLAEGDASKPLAVTVHGINGDPDDVQPFIDDAAASGKTTLTFCYDDQYRRLSQSSRELAAQLGRWIDEHPDRPLEISAHSMGSRVVLSALDRLNQQGKLTMPVELRMVAPPLGGYGSANMAALAPKFIGERIAGVQPGKDMGTWSRFQRDLEGLRLPPNVKVTVFTGGRDDVVDSTGDRFKRVVDGLGARVVHFPDADHMSVIEKAAAQLR